jgi:hypothetical protein
MITGSASINKVTQVSVRYVSMVREGIVVSLGICTVLGRLILTTGKEICNLETNDGQEPLRQQDRPAVVEQ